MLELQADSLALHHVLPVLQGTHVLIRRTVLPEWSLDVVLEALMKAWYRELSNYLPNGQAYPIQNVVGGRLLFQETRVTNVDMELHEDE
ncbi:UNVERIFIED_CONTAM: hypothetical protein FKN15_034375 [Acipenser sinensis]